MKTLSMVFNEPYPSAIYYLTVCHLLLSMTTLLAHTVTHSTKPSFMPITNKQPSKKFLTAMLAGAVLESTLLDLRL